MITSNENFIWKFKRNVEFFIVESITDLIFSKPLNISRDFFPVTIYYANSIFYKLDKIDALLGVGNLYQLIKLNQIELKDESIVLKKTGFGLVTSGFVKIHKQEGYYWGLVNNFENVNNEIIKFYELESISIKDTELISGEDKAKKTP